MRITTSHLITLVMLTLFLPATYGVEISAQESAEVGQAGEEQVTEDNEPSLAPTEVVTSSAGLPWAFWSLTGLAGIVLLVLVGLLLYRLIKERPQRRGLGIDEIRPRALIGGMMGVLLLYGFFFTLYHLLGMLPRNNAEADDIPGEYWLFIGQALGIIGSLALNVATYYFGSASSGEDEGPPNERRE